MQMATSVKNFEVDNNKLCFNLIGQESEWYQWLKQKTVSVGGEEKLDSYEFRSSFIAPYILKLLGSYGSSGYPLQMVVQEPPVNSAAVLADKNWTIKRNWDNWTIKRVILLHKSPFGTWQILNYYPIWTINQLTINRSPLYSSLISEKNSQSDRPKCRRNLVKLGSTQKYAWK